jgi:hypothetical protein
MHPRLPSPSPALRPLNGIQLASGSIRFANLTCSGSSQLLQTDAGGNIICGTDDTSTGAAGLFATTTDSLAIIESDITKVLLVGTISTSTTGNIFEVSGNSLFRNNLVAYGGITAPFFVATSTSASTLPYASSTAVTAGNLVRDEHDQR